MNFNTEKITEQNSVESGNGLRDLHHINRVLSYYNGYSKWGRSNKNTK